MFDRLAYYWRQPAVDSKLETGYVHFSHTCSYPCQLIARGNLFIRRKHTDTFTGQRSGVGRHRNGGANHWNDKLELVTRDTH